MPAKKTKKRNPNDATMRNIRALKTKQNKLSKDMGYLLQGYKLVLARLDSLEKLAKIVRTGR